jgi:hypothetical protein
MAGFTKQSRFYLAAAAACLAGFAWLALNYIGRPHGVGVQACLFKHVTHLPCPSCGSTRSILSLLGGDVSGAFHGNPIGMVLFAALAVLPFWISYDLVSGKETLREAYRKAESLFQRKRVAIPAVALVLLNWIWNISKGL